MKSRFSISAIRMAWKKRSRTHQNQYLIASLAIIASLAYAINLYSQQSIFKIEQKIAAVNEKANAIRTVGEVPPGTSIADLHEALKVLRLGTTQLLDRERELTNRFAPKGDLVAHQNLKIAISAMANRCDLLVDEFTDIGISAAEIRNPPNSEMWAKLADNPYQRPLIQFKARASYRGLMQFLEGLKTLPYLVAPVRFEIEVKYRKDNAGDLKQWLEISMDLSL
ncbi:hypothetical protein [Chitinibacter sp. S2-10]|uniref:hypothetical protein n=1 Tax=Chitinibacter sp. S2-10 TaxID=3373597 RepID=UPI0039776AB3